jgi:16S rRNA (adenine1518-N6/adenine1519-N6)-dimethyltransferase
MTDHIAILDRYKISPKKSLGQNFLVNDEILDQIASITSVEGENIIEVGPGYGALTAKLLALLPASLTLVEYDSEMVKILLDRLVRGDFGEARMLSLQDVNERKIVHPLWSVHSEWIPTGIELDSPKKWTPPLKKSAKIYPEIFWQVGPTLLTIHQGDILDFSPICSSKVIANIPYYITSPILFRFLYEVSHTPSELIVLMQREVADKIREVRGNKPSYLSTALGAACFAIEESLTVAPDNFNPSPKVDSTVLHLRSRPWKYEFTRDQFLRVLGAGHLHPRKKLVSNLAEGLGISKWEIEELCLNIGLKESVRAGELSMEEWEALVALFKGH